jgi:plasmid stabilization system protein ParE
MIQIRLSNEAWLDLDEGFWFYETQEPGLGDHFASCLRADIEGLRLTAGTHRVVYADYHRLLSRVVPHGVFYTLEGDCAVIWAVIDLRRDPQWIRNKLNP